MLKHILWAGLGAGAGFYVAREYLKADFDARLQSEIEQTRTFYKNLYEEKLKRETAKTKEQADILKAAVAEVTDSQEEDVKRALEEILAKVPDVELVDVVSPHPDIPEQEEPEELPEEVAIALVNYQGISAASGNSEPVGGIRRIIDRSAEEDDLTYVKPDGPRLITFNQYSENAGDYVQQTVVYHAKDQVVSDEVDLKLERSYIGRHISYANLATLNEDNKTIYVRDDKNRTDHEVIWSAMSFAVDVLGEDPK
jgi:hypothetical protein